MPTDSYLDQQKRIAQCRYVLIDGIRGSSENDISIWIAALIETLKRVSDWNLEAERKGNGDSA